MTAIDQRVRTGVPPSVAGRHMLWAVVAANVVVVETLFFTAGWERSAGSRPPNVLLSVGKFFGLHATLVMLLQLTLISRLPWLDRRIGMDRLTAWHRWVGFTLFWTVLLHLSFISVGFATMYNMTPWQSFVDLAQVPASLFGICAAATIATVVTLSLRAVRRRLRYETWHALHMLVYAVIVLAIIHQAYEGTTFKTTTLATVYWWTLWSLVLLNLIVGRALVPLWRNAYHRFRVEAVVPEADNVTSVHVTGRRLDRLPARAGQFMIWRFPGHNHWWRANPFSLSAAPNGQRLRLTAKAVGDTSAGLRHLPVGTRVFAEGPYGAFTSLHRTRDATLLIAGGVGITPIRSLLEELTGPVVVLYRVATPAEAVLLPELEALAAQRGAEVHLLTGRTGAGNPPNAPFEPGNLAALVPDITERDVFVCGPPAMTNAVLKSLRALKVPNHQVHAERFSLA
jgi:predicted ferric reductase